MIKPRYMKQEQFDYLVGAYTLAKFMKPTFDQTDVDQYVKQFLTAFDTTLKHYPSEDRTSLRRLVNHVSFSIERIVEGLVKSLANQRITYEPFQIMNWLCDYLWKRALERHSFKTKVRTIFLGY